MNNKGFADDEGNQMDELIFYEKVRHYEWDGTGVYNNKKGKNTSFDWQKQK